MLLLIKSDIGLDAVIIIYTVHNSYSSAWKIPYKMVDRYLSRLKNLKGYKVTSYIFKNKKRKKVYPPPYPHKLVLQQQKRTVIYLSHNNII